MCCPDKDSFGVRRERQTGCGQSWTDGLTSETVQSATLTLQGVNYVHGGDGLPLGVLGVGDSVTDDVLKEHLEDAAGLLVDESGDTFDSTTASQTTDGGLGDALDVVTQNFTMTLGASFPEPLSTFASSGHGDIDSTFTLARTRRDDFRKRPEQYLWGRVT